MRIYTSYFGNYERLHQAGIKIISISDKSLRNVPIDARLRALVAPEALYERFETGKPYYDQDIERFTELYKKYILGPRTAEEVVTALMFASKNLFEGADVALCAHPLPGEFSHRSIVAEWLNEYLVFDDKKVREYKAPAQRFRLNDNFKGL